MVFTKYGRELIRDYISTNIVSVAFGSSGSPDYTEQEDITLGAEFLRIDKSSTDTSRRTTVIFETIVPTTMGIGSLFREVGLFNTSVDNAGSVIARSVYPTIEKTDIYEVNFVYSIKIV